MATLQFPCFTDWDLSSYILSTIYAYKLGLIPSTGTCTGTQSNTWGFDCRIQDVINFLMNRPLNSGTPYDFYCDGSSLCQSGGGYQVCSLHLPTSAPTSASDTGRLLGALSILETVTRAYDSDVTTILARSTSTYKNFASNCCNGADYYQYLMAEGYAAFSYPSCCGVFAAIHSYSGPYFTLNSQQLPEIDTLSEPFNLEILLGQAHSTDTTFLSFANRVYSVQQVQFTNVGNLTAWTEGVYPQSYVNCPAGGSQTLAYIYEWILLQEGSTFVPWQLTGPGFLCPPTSDGSHSPELAFTKTAFAYLAIYGSNAYTDAMVNAVSTLTSCPITTSCGFGEAVYQGGSQKGQSAENLWTPTTGFYSDKTQEQVLEAAFYAITHSPTFLSFGSQISSVASADVNSAWFVLPDFTAGESGSMHTSAGKCGGHVAALATDVYAATYLFGALVNASQNEVLDTNSVYVSQLASSCGDPSTPVSQPLVAVAGAAVNEVVGYYETVQGTSPLYYGTSGAQTGCIVNRASGTSLDCSTPTATNDVFIMEAFRDSANRTVFIIYGRQWPGTLAGFQYVVNFVLKNPSAYTASWYVYRWQDAASGPSANGIPDPGDTYTQIATGP